MAKEFKIKKGLLVEGSGSTGDENLVDVQGNSGQLFSVTDSLSGGTVIGGISTTTPSASIQEGVSSVYGDMSDWDSLYASGEIIKNVELGEACEWGHCMSLQDSFKWYLADPSEVSVSNTMLGVALETGGEGDFIDVLIKGFVEVTTWVNNPTMRNGKPLYLREGGTGRYSEDAPTSAPNVVRLVGYAFQNDSTNSNSKFILRFDPDNTWVEL